MNSKIVYQTVTALDYTLIDMMCLTTIIYNDNAANIASSYSLALSIIYVHADHQSSNIPTYFPYQDYNRMFFGISAINLDLLQAITQDLFIDTDSYTNFDINYTATSNVIDI
jgi:hypothetical protein